MLTKRAANAANGETIIIAIRQHKVSKEWGEKGMGKSVERVKFDARKLLEKDLELTN